MGRGEERKGEGGREEREVDTRGVGERGGLAVPDIGTKRSRWMDECEHKSIPIAGYRQRTPSDRYWLATMKPSCKHLQLHREVTFYSSFHVTHQTYTYIKGSAVRRKSRTPRCDTQLPYSYVFLYAGADGIRMVP